MKKIFLLHFFAHIFCYQLFAAQPNPGDTSGGGDIFSGGGDGFPLPRGQFTTGGSQACFGMRRHPVTGKIRGHAGIDLRASGGTKVLASESGRVIYAGWFGGYGNTTIIQHGSKATLYGHLRSLPPVRAGQTVSAGQIIGAVGSTGVSTGNHLHYEVRSGSVDGHSKDPRAAYLSLPAEDPLISIGNKIEGRAANPGAARSWVNMCRAKGAGLGPAAGAKPRGKKKRSTR